MTEVPCLIDSVNSGDVFILDTKQIVYLFYGSESNKIERQKVRTILFFFSFVGLDYVFEFELVASRLVLLVE